MRSTNPRRLKQCARCAAVKSEPPPPFNLDAMCALARARVQEQIEVSAHGAITAMRVRNHIAPIVRDLIGKCLCSGGFVSGGYIGGFASEPCGIVSEPFEFFVPRSAP